MQQALFSGGPFDRVLDALDPRAGPRRRVLERCVVIALVAWAPMAIASYVEGTFFGGTGSFARDVLVHTRLLVSVPLLMMGARAIERRFGEALDHLERAGLVPAERRPGFHAAIESVGRLRRATWPDVVLVVLVAALAADDVAKGDFERWMEPVRAPNATLSFAGAWDLCVALPIYRFLVGRWLWHLGLWFVLLVRIARVPLRLEATHPDRMAGLRFLSDAHESLGWVVLALSCTLAASLITQLRRTGGSVDALTPSIATFCIAAPLVAIGPMLAFAWPLERARRKRHDDYGAAAADLSRRYVATHIAAPSATPFALDGPEPSTHIDMSSSFQNTIDTTRLPVRRTTMILLAACAALPMVAVYMQQLPIAEILKRLRGLLG
ncbi:hypothetical protein [Sandaracinus amylolyticus]|uniref:hypothetical protein n=1 Tax=Sandaracinus amylolyticus TaxID=927083 RepID=UPI001F233C52|nr:hypothetical protein [Sandaracinus amylolyticus]UJR86256.1 Hypothetical protein I5071_83380 [Sandaracinus amylolyticus]